MERLGRDIIWWTRVFKARSGSRIPSKYMEVFACNVFFVDLLCVNN
jgi:hypothetical protein